MLAACEAVERDIKAGCNLVVLNKFGKVEAVRIGLAAAFAAAITAQALILTSVSPKFNTAWDQFAAPLYVVPPRCGPIMRWWRNVRAEAALERQAPARAGGGVYESDSLP